LRIIKFVGLPVYAGYLISNFLTTGNTFWLLSGIITGIVAINIQGTIDDD